VNSSEYLELHTMLRSAQRMRWLLWGCLLANVAVIVSRMLLVHSLISWWTLLNFVAIGVVLDALRMNRRTRERLLAALGGEA
jgi:hypothetical protein